MRLDSLIVRPCLMHSILALVLSLLTATTSHAYTDSAGEDVILDAPWRTIRDYVPVLVYTAELSPARTAVTLIEIRNFNEATGQAEGRIFQDNIDGTNDFSCSTGAGNQPIRIIDPTGRARGGIRRDEIRGDHWHYIVRVPTACIGIGPNRGQPGKHLIEARVRWTIVPGDDRETRHVMRVIVDIDGFPRFSRIDRYYDIHYHTIAEQTTGDLDSVDSAYRAFGGPLAMVLESAFAVGLIDKKLTDGNWAHFRNLIATTDHNVFYSGGEFDEGTPPRFGPTANTDGKIGEFNFYRENFGILGGEEVTLHGTGRFLTSASHLRQGSHFLVYGAPHFEGPWHGGKFEVHIDALGIDAEFPGVNDTGAENNLTLPHVLHEMAGVNAFGYAAHPFSGVIGWSKEHFDRAIGLRPFNTPEHRSALVNDTADDFVFKGSQVWNGKAEFITALNADGTAHADSTTDNIDTFSAASRNQKFVFRSSWDKTFLSTLQEYLDQVRSTLNYNFSEQPQHIFSRKIYLSAGTDAHGDFNHEIHNDSVTAESELADAFTIDLNSVSYSSNAFARVRTYALAGDRDVVPGEAINFAGFDLDLDAEDAVLEGLAGSGGIDKDAGKSVEAYREGNTVATDGPICMFHIDTNCRFNSDPESLKWHDASCGFVNHDGAIGGIGNFDGGRTALVANDSPEIFMRSKWAGRNQYFHSSEGSPDAIKFETIQTMQEAGRTISQESGNAGRFHAAPLQGFVAAGRGFGKSAILLKGELGSGERRSMCLTNPIWTAPYRISIVPAIGTCPFEPGALRVNVVFGTSMRTTLKEPCDGCAIDPTAPPQFFGTQILIKPLDENGRSGDVFFKLGNRQWFNHNLAGESFPVVADASLSATNLEQIPCPDGDWDTSTHQRTIGKKSYAVVVTDIVDMHNNRLNPIARSFTAANESPIPTEERPEEGEVAPVNP